MQHVDRLPNGASKTRTDRGKSSEHQRLHESSQWAYILVLLTSWLIGGTAHAEVAAASPDQVRPEYRSMRFDEDWSSLADPERHSLPLDNLKWVPIGEDSAMTIGGEFRLRAEFYDEVDLGLGSAEANDYLLARLMIHADVHAGKHLRGFLQLRIGDVRGASPSLSATQDNDLDVNQAFWDLGVPVGGGRVTLRVGRQELAFGSGRFIAPREGPNIRQSFDGARWFWQGPAGGRLDVFYTQPVVAKFGAFDDNSSDAYRFWGVYAALPVVLAPHLGLDAYYLGADRARIAFAQGTDAQRRHTLGGRIHGQAGGWDWDLEAAYQFGRFGASDIRAFTFANEVGYRPRGLAWAPRLGVRFDLASGDGDLSDSRLETLEVPFPRLPYLTEPNFVTPANIIDIHPSLTLNPRKNVRISLDYIAVWKHRTADAVYLPPLRPVLATRDGGRFIQQILQGGGRWQVTPQTSLEVIYAHSFVGDAVRRAGGRDANFLSLTATARF